MTSLITSNAWLNEDFDDNPETADIRKLTDRLGHIREISDALWQATAKVGLTLGTLDAVESILHELKTEISGTPDDQLLGIGYASRLSSVLKDNIFEGTNLLLDTKGMDVLTDSDMQEGNNVKIFQTIKPINLGLNNGPIVMARSEKGNAVRLSVTDGSNATKTFSALERIRIRLRAPNMEPVTVNPNFTWTHTPRTICAVLQATIKSEHPTIGDVSVTFDGRHITIGGLETDVTIDAVSLQGPHSGALASIRTLLGADTPCRPSILGALELALVAVEDARSDFTELQEDIGRMETLTLNMMERVAMLTAKPSPPSTEKAALEALKVSQGIAKSEINIANVNADALLLMATEMKTLN